MELKLNLEQVTYLKDLDSKKKQRKFLLDCLVESIIGESEKSEKVVITSRGLFPMSDEISDLIDSGKTHTWYSKNFKEVEDKFNEMASKITDLPSQKAEEINRLNSHYTTTTASKTFQGDTKIVEQDELLKFDALEENPIEIGKKIKILGKEYLITEKDGNEFTIVKSNQSANSKKTLHSKMRFNNGYLLDHKRFETLEEVVKYLMDERLANSEKKYTEEDMCTAFFKGRETERKEELVKDENHLPYNIDVSFKEWFEKFNKFAN